MPESLDQKGKRRISIAPERAIIKAAIQMDLITPDQPEPRHWSYGSSGRPYHARSIGQWRAIPHIGRSSE